MHLFTQQERRALLLLLAVYGCGLGSTAVHKDRQSTASTQLQTTVAINQATAEQLSSLPGIGPVTAQRIVAARQDGGRFLSPTDLERVEGLSRKTVGQLIRYVRFN